MNFQSAALSMPIALALAFAALPAFAGDLTPGAVAQEIAAASAGQTVDLPAGTFAMAIILPPGVSLQGAGYGKTIIDATGNAYGIKLAATSAISDLTVRSASTADILGENGSQMRIRCVRATGAMIGIDLQGVVQALVQNSIADNNRYGIVVSGGSDDCVVNCSAVDNTNMGLSFASGDRIVAFNNLSTGSSVAVNVGADAHNVNIDYNLLTGVCIGKAPGRTSPRATMNDWHFVSGLDAHSVSIPVRFADPVNGRFVAVNTLDWSPNRPVTSGWGTPLFAGVSAPIQDIDGNFRAATPGVGAFEAQAPTVRPADGVFTVPGGEGLTSTGVFDRSGKLVSYLFQEMPLAPGKYPFWLPARTYTGAPIAAGTYEVRVVKADMKWRAVGWFGNTMNQGQDNLGAPCATAGIAFDNDGHFFAGDTPSDTFKNLRAADAASGKWTWAFWGTETMPGPTLTVAKDGLLYIMRNMGSQGMCVGRLHTDTGRMVMEGTVGGEIPLGDEAKSFTGMTALGDRLCYTDTAGNAVRFGTLESPVPTSAVTVPMPTCPAGDEKSGVVWVISGGKVVGVSPATSATYTLEVASPLAIAARDGVLAVASGSTGKIAVYDVSNPASPTLLRTIGRGDGPDGQILPDRFLFQDNPSVVPTLAIGPDQTIAVSDEWRIEVFNRDNTLRWMTWGHWGGGDVASRSHPGRVYDDWGFSYLADGIAGTWKPESYHRAMAGTVLGDCVIHGQTFVLFWGSPYKSGPAWSETLVRFSPDKAEQVISLECGGQSGALVARRDTNGNGMIDAADTATPVLDASGKPVTGSIFHYMYNNVLPDGSLVSAQTSSGSWLTVWPCAGLDSSGVPIYRWPDRVATMGADRFVSPFNWKQSSTGVGQFEPRPGGGWYILSDITSSPRFGKSVFNNGGSDMIGIDKSGAVDWVQPFVQFIRIGAETSANGLCLVGEGETAEFQVLNSDGLELPGFSADAPWLDHVQAGESFVDQAGKINVLVTDCTRSCYHWYRLDTCDIRSTTGRVEIGTDLAAMLAALPASPPSFSTGQPPSITFTVPHLSAPLPIDGDLQKWRDAGITPQVILTPDIGGVNIDGGPRDCSLIARFAWEGDDLYFQAFKFDNVVVTDLPQSRAYMGDTIEMAVNGPREGIKFNLSITSDDGPTIYADGGEPYRCKILANSDAPRVFKVLGDARSVTERSLLESITGLDMSDCKVEYFEAKIPIDRSTYEGKESALWDVKSGSSFWLGLQIDDNDEPGADQVRFISWPLGYGYYNPPDADAKAVLE